jgi:hypothetical protein
MKKLKKSLTVYAVNRLWRKDPNDIFFTVKVIKTGVWKQKVLFVMTIPANTIYDERTDSADITEYLFVFGNKVFQVHVKG